MAGCACKDDRYTATDLKHGGSGQPAHSAGPPSENMTTKNNNSSFAPRKQQWPEMGSEEEFDGGAL